MPVRQNARGQTAKLAAPTDANVDVTAGRRATSDQRWVIIEPQIVAQMIIYSHKVILLQQIRNLPGRTEPDRVHPECNRDFSQRFQRNAF